MRFRNQKVARFFDILFESIGMAMRFIVGPFLVLDSFDEAYKHSWVQLVICLSVLYVIYLRDLVVERHNARIEASYQDGSHDDL